MVIVQDTSQNDEDFPLGHVFSGPGVSQSTHAKYTRKYLGFNPNMVITKGPTSVNQMRNITTSISVDPLLEVSIDYIINGPDTSGYQATFNSADHYYGSDHNIIFIAIDPDGAEGIDTLFATIEPLNDPPVINDSLNTVYEVEVSLDKRNQIPFLANRDFMKRANLMINPARKFMLTNRNDEHKDG